MGLLFGWLFARTGRLLPFLVAHLLIDAIAFVGVARFPARVKCALLGWSAFKDAAAQALAGQTATSTKENR